MKKMITGAIALITINFLISGSAYPQSKIEAYQLTYHIHITGGCEESDSAKLPPEFLEANEKNPALVAYVNKDWIRVESDGFPPYIQISNLKDSTAFKYYPRNASTLDTIKKAYAIPMATPTLRSDMKGEELVVFSSDDMQMQLLADTQTIANRLCKLAHFNMTDNVGLDVWYTPDLPKLFWGEYDYLSRVPGTALRIEVFEPGTKIKIGISADKVETVQVDPALFALPKGYTLIQEEQLEEMPSDE